MTHLSTTLPPQIELGAVRNLDYRTQVVMTDGGREVRNNRWATPLKTFELSFPPMKRSNPVYIAVLDLYEAALGGLHSFNFTDWTDETGATVVPVRFVTPLSIKGIDTIHDHIENITLQEVRL